MNDNTSYLEWNSKLAAHFFHSEMAEKPVHLYATKELIAGLGIGSSDDFIAAVKVGPSWTQTYSGICQKAHHCFQNWRLGSYKDFPPYIAYLVLFVLAAGEEGNFPRHAYYPRLWKLLGEDREGTPPSFDRMWDLWDDLEKWANQDKQGRVGIFNSYIAGKRFHIGLPIAQTILTEDERKSLPTIFAEAHIEPATPSSDAELAELLQRYGKAYLRTRTLSLLTRPKDETDFYEVLIETIQEELANWDGTVEVAGEDSGSQPKRVYDNLRLCFKYDRVASKLTAYFICSLKRDYPEEGLHLKAKRSQEVFTCDESMPGWSSPLRHLESAAPVDSSSYDWDADLEFEDERLRWRFRFFSNPIRIFVSGEREGLSGFVEVRQLPRAQNFYIAAKSNCLPLLRQWAESGSKGFEEIKIRSGLPANWSLFRIAEALSDELIRKTYPHFSFANVVRLSLQNGIRSSQGNTFFDFGVPDAIIEGGNGAEKFFCNDCELTLENDAYKFPDGLPVGTQLRVQVKRGDETVKQRSFYLSHGSEPAWYEPTKLFTKFGESNETSNLEAGVVGAFLKESSFPPYKFKPSQERGYLIGSTPGQIISWPDEPFPETWAPVWMITMKKARHEAVFCGTNISEAMPAMSFVDNRKKVKQWKEVLWHWRKRIAPPSPVIFQKLWKQFQEAARDV